LAGVSRARMHQIVTRDMFKVPGDHIGFPFKPTRKPPEGQYRFEDTAELRAWCKEKKKSKPRATPNLVKSRPQYSTSRIKQYPWKVEGALPAAARAIDSRRATRVDLTNALKLLESCGRLFLTVIEQPCTRGVLAIASHDLLRTYSSRRNSAHILAEHYDLWRDYLTKAIANLPKESQPSQKQPA
jgi:hypothetical protein